MKRGIVLSMLGIGLAASTANAGILSMRFAGGGNEVTLAPSQSATIEVLFAMTNLDKAAHQVTGLDARFEVGSLGSTAAGDYVVDGSTKLSVTSVTAGAFPNWTTGATTPPPAPFNASGFFLNVGTSEGPFGPVGNGTNQLPVVLATFTIHKDTTGAGDTFIAFRQGAALPAVYQGGGNWASRFGYATINGGQQYEMGQGNPGDDRPQDQYHGYETFQPLIIHQIPEPSALALLGLGGLAMLRRRK